MFAAVVRLGEELLALPWVGEARLRGADVYECVAALLRLKSYMGF